MDDTLPKIKFQADVLVNFWISSPVYRENNKLYSVDIKLLIQFASTFLYEKSSVTSQNENKIQKLTWYIYADPKFKPVYI